MKIRRAVDADIPQMFELMDERRRLYETYQPMFWRRAPNARSAQAAFFRAQVSNTKNAIVLVCEDARVFRGFVIANLIEAPPIYAPGGKTCVIDDFAVADNDWDEPARALLDEVHSLARVAGAVQGVVICGHLN